MMVSEEDVLEAAGRRCGSGQEGLRVVGSLQMQSPLLSDGETLLLETVEGRERALTAHWTPARHCVWAR